MVLLYCDLAAQKKPALELPEFLEVERKKHETDLNSQDLRELNSFWNPKLADRRIKERFAQGASLWVIKCEGQLAGFGWTLQGQTIEPHFFLLGVDDLHLFDFHVFPQYRGRRLNPLLVNYILSHMAIECHGRAFIEAAEWNLSQLASLRRTSFRQLGLARKFTLFRHAIVCFHESKIVERQPEEHGKDSSELPANNKEIKPSIMRA
jgi:ribosomal protein S18 acetylase RimI-like enzyme